MGVGSALGELLRERQFDMRVERAIFAMAVNRALALSSKLVMENWITNDVFIDELDEVQVYQLYRAMDFLIASNEHIQDQVFFSTPTPSHY